MFHPGFTLLMLGSEAKEVLHTRGANTGKKEMEKKEKERDGWMEKHAGGGAGLEGVGVRDVRAREREEETEGDGGNRQRERERKRMRGVLLPLVGWVFTEQNVDEGQG